MKYFPFTLYIVLEGEGKTTKDDPMVPYTSYTYPTQRDYAACDVTNLMLKILIQLMCWYNLSSKPFPEILKHALLAANSQRLDSLLDVWNKHTQIWCRCSLLAHSDDAGASR